MPPFIMLLFAAFVVGMLIIGNNPVEQWKADAEKYGKDPLARQINKFNDEQSKNASSRGNYKPPPGSTVYRLPPEEAQLTARNPFRQPGEEDLVRPAPEMPIEQWGNPYPSYMTPQVEGSDFSNQSELFRKQRNTTSIMPGSGVGRTQ